LHRREAWGKAHEAVAGDPAPCGAARPLRPPGREPLVTAGKLRRILLVEDDEDIQAIAAMALDNLGGFTVLVCGSGREALKRMAGFEPDLILLDVVMPGMDGPATLRALRDIPEAALTPVAFMTARAQARDVQALGELGVQGVITKPFDPMTLCDTVREIWESRAGVAEQP